MKYFAGNMSLLLWSIPGLAQTPDSIAGLPDAEQIVERMQAADTERSAKLEGYVAVRRYELTNRRFHKSALIVARLTYRSPGEKSFEVISEEGSKLLRDRVLKRVINTEEDASRGANRDLARINLVNYAIKVVGTEMADGHTRYVLDLTPKSKSPYLIRGRAWIDASEYALVRMEGVVAKKPSMWVGSPVVKQTYIKSGSFWLPEKNVSTTEAPIFGKTDLLIESSGYEIREKVSTTP